MRVSFICLFSLIGSFASAQMSYPPSIKVFTAQPKKQKGDTSLPEFNKHRLKAHQQASENQMPNAISNQQRPSFVFKGNNGGGFDIYESNLDRMAVIRPDKHYKSTIPTIGYSNNPRIILSMPQQSLTDSLSKIKKP